MSSQANLRQSDGADRVASTLTGWATNAHGTLAQRLAHSLRRAIAVGTLAGGTRLPPERRLAEALAVSRSTVTAAFDELRAEGLLTSRQGSGTVVTDTTTPGAGGTRIAEHFAGSGGVDLATGNPADPSHLPPLQLDVATLIAGGEGPGVQPLGLRSLRAALAGLHRDRGRHTDADQVHVTAGAHQAVALLVGIAAGRNTPVAVEELAYPGIYDMIETLGARPVPVAADRAGPRPEPLDALLTAEAPPVFYLQAGPHNPTGRVTSPGRLRALAAVLDRHPGTLVIEDTTLADLTFGGRPRVEMADLCRKAVVATVGSLSKLAWAGLRVGWLRAPAPLVERTMLLQLATDLGPSVPSQLLALQLLPHYEAIAEQRRAVLESTVGQTVAILRRDLPEWTVVEPGGGVVLWVETPVPDTGPFVQLAARHGVHIAPGAVAVIDRRPNAFLRICIDRPMPVIEEGIRRLGTAWRELQPTLPRVLG